LKRGWRRRLVAKMPIRIKTAIKPAVKHICAGCGAETSAVNFYEGDTELAWCNECFVTEEELVEIQSKMPFCQKKKIKVRVAPAPEPEAKPKKIKVRVVKK